MKTAPPTDNLFLSLNNVLQEAALHSGGHGDIPAILKHIEASIEKLVTTIKPKELLFITMDGVAPNATLNHHRSKNFKLGENMKLAAAAAARRGETLKSFDLNALTPGTAFMVDLQSTLKDLIRAKIKDDPSWPPNVILSGCDVPGEGDHKILEYLRNMKCSGDWSPNQRHCFYGLDAQTVIMSLVIHEPHCYLFKESSSRPKGSKGPAAREMLESTSQEDFISCSISLLRDYIELEFKNTSSRGGGNTGSSFDLERVIDDFVLFCIISGNDFLPSLETFDGMDMLLENLLESYKAVFPNPGAYITHVGRINGERLQKVLEHCSEREEMRIIQILREIKEGHCEVDGVHIHRDFLFKSNRAARDIFNACETAEQAIQAWKNRHYYEKLQVSLEDKAQLVADYFKGLNWAMRGYYRGVPSWTWMYPHHYAPMISDLKNMDPAQVLFKLGSPAPTWLYLMAVLPRASHKLVPRVMESLMLDPKSTLSSYYPNDCRVDMEGKRLEREAVVLLPIFDEQKFQQTLYKIPRGEFSDEEMERMRVGYSLSFTSDQGLIRVHFLKNSPLPGGLNNRSDRNTFRGSGSIDLQDISLSSLKAFRSELAAGSLTSLDAPYGYWSLKSMDVVPQLKKNGVCLYSYPSERPSVHLTLPPAINLSSLESLIGRMVYVDWPTLKKARVIQIETNNMAITSKSQPSSDKNCNLSEMRSLHRELSITKQKYKAEDWLSKGQAKAQNLMEKRGIDVGRIEVLVTVKPISGSLRCGLDNIQERHGPVETYPLQALLLENPYHNHASELDQDDCLKLSSHDRLLYLGADCPGTVATVVEDPEEKLIEKDKVLVTLQPQPSDILESFRISQELLRTTVEQYYPSGAVATRLGVTPQGLSRITGSLWVSTGIARHEIGLAVKLGSKNMCVVGYVRPSPNGTGWEYTESLISILESYRQTFYWVFEAVDATPEGGEINLKNVFTQMTEENLDEMVRTTKEWLSRLPLNGRPLISAEARVGSIIAMKKAQHLQAKHKIQPKPVKTYLSKTQLIPPADRSPVASKEAGGEMLIGDLVSYIGSTLIGFGSMGVVIGTLTHQVEVLFSNQVLTSVSMFGDSTKKYSCLVSSSDLVNLSALTGESRVQITHQSANNNNSSPSHRSKSMNSHRNNARYPSPSPLASGWSRSPHWMSNEGFQSPSIIHMRPPMIALGTYGSGVYIPGMSPMHGNVQGHHPAPYVNYQITPRY